MTVEKRTGLRWGDESSTFTTIGLERFGITKPALYTGCCFPKALSFVIDCVLGLYDGGFGRVHGSSLTGAHLESMGFRLIIGGLERSASDL